MTTAPYDFRLLRLRARRIAATVSLAAVGVLALTGCEGDADDAEPVGETVTTEGSGEAALPEETANPESADSNDVPAPETPEEPAESVEEPPDHGGALAAGLSGDIPIVCLYTYSAEEFEGLQLLAQGGWVSPTADVYAYGPTIYWEHPQEGDSIAHVLGVDGDTYTWGTPGSGDGVAAKSEAQALAAIPALLESNATSCEVYTGSTSVFEVPTDISFQWVE